jgi:hypothetical protein
MNKDDDVITLKASKNVKMNARAKRKVSTRLNKESSLLISSVDLRGRPR